MIALLFIAAASSSPVTLPLPFQRDVRVELGFKGQFLTQSSTALGTLAVSWAPWSVSRFSLAPGLRYELGDGINRGLLTLDARYRTLRWLELSARGAVGFLAQRITDTGGTFALQGDTASATGDLSGAVSFLLGPHRHIDTRRVRVWWTFEGGYSFATTARVVLTPQLPAGDTRQTGSVTTTAPHFQGAFFRTSIALGF